MKTDWDKKKDKALANIGFISRLGAFRDPTPAEVARAIMIETESWQKTKGLKPYKVSNEYKNPQGNHINLKSTRDVGHKAEHRKEAINAYMDVPINIGKDVWLVMSWWTAFRYWLRGHQIKRDSFITKEKK